jgi:hypothetical protein
VRSNLEIEGLQADLTTEVGNQMVDESESVTDERYVKAEFRLPVADFASRRFKPSKPTRK